jgi:hypothetical protein
MTRVWKAFVWGLGFGREILPLRYRLLSVTISLVVTVPFFIAAIALGADAPGWWYAFCAAILVLSALGDVTAHAVWRRRRT